MKITANSNVFFNAGNNMIQLQTIPKPIELTSKVVQELTTLYKQDGTLVWQQRYIKKALLDMSYNKCCYCECNIIEESNYLEVEHFHPKNLYPDEVVSWENLLQCAHFVL